MWGGGAALLQIPLMQVAQQRLPVGTVAAVSQRIVVNRTVKIGREFRQYGEDAVRLPQFEQQFLNEVLGRSGTAHKRCGVGAEGLVVTDVKFLPGSGVFPVDPGYEIFSLGPLHLHNYMSPATRKPGRALLYSPESGPCNKGYGCKYKYFAPIYRQFGHFSAPIEQAVFLHISTKKRGKNDIYSGFRPMA